MDLVIAIIVFLSMISSLFYAYIDLNLFYIAAISQTSFLVPIFWGIYSILAFCIGFSLLFPMRTHNPRHVNVPLGMAGLFVIIPLISIFILILLPPRLRMRDELGKTILIADIIVLAFNVLTTLMIANFKAQLKVEEQAIANHISYADTDALEP